MSLALLFHYLLFNMFRMLIHPSSGACDLFVELLHGLYGSHFEPEQYNPCNKSSNKSQTPEDGCISIRSMLSSK